jgi:uncharacterized protein (TIGR02001 family)
MRKSLLGLSLAAALAAPGLASAQAAASSPHTVAGNATLASDYRFRGLTQTFEEPAFQGGFDYTHSSGFYAGNWNSNISDTLYAGSPLEMDFYAGWKPTFGPITADIGVLYYFYPGSDSPTLGKIDNTEVYVGATWKWISLKYFHAVSDFFAAPDTKGSNYIDLTASLDLGRGFGVVGHVGHQKVKNFGDLDYTDYKLGVTKDIGGWVFGLAYIDTDAEEALYTFTNAIGKAVNIGDATVVLSVSKTF